jgi:Family of unknown function (DUF5690)
MRSADTNTIPRTTSLLFAAGAAFGTYFCMYAFRRPFTAGTYDGQTTFGVDFKAAAILAQLAGYTLSKFVGIKVISEIRREHCAATIVGLILVAEAALVGFAFLPLPGKVAVMFVNGLALGMVFGLILTYLEGRRQTEALTAALCASFILASGVVKSIGQTLIVDLGTGEFRMPMLVGVVFFVPLLASVALLRATPPPSDADRRSRRERGAMDREQRRRFVAAYWPVLVLIAFVYTAVTVVRTIRDDFGVELWRDLGAADTPAVFASMETIVAVCVTGVSGLAILIPGNRTALRVIVGLMLAAFVLVGESVLLLGSGVLSPFGFMTACGIGLYIPYVAIHTSVFERLIAATRHPCNLGFLLYLADAFGYLGYAIVIVVKMSVVETGGVLPFFRGALLVVATTSIVALAAALFLFQRLLAREDAAGDAVVAGAPMSEPEPVR